MSLSPPHGVTDTVEVWMDGGMTLATTGSGSFEVTEWLKEGGWSEGMRLNEGMREWNDERKESG